MQDINIKQNEMKKEVKILTIISENSGLYGKKKKQKTKLKYI